MSVLMIISPLSTGFGRFVLITIILRLLQYYFKILKDTSISILNVYLLYLIFIVQTRTYTIFRYNIHSFPKKLTSPFILREKTFSAYTVTMNASFSSHSHSEIGDLTMRLFQWSKNAKVTSELYRVKQFPRVF